MSEGKKELSIEEKLSMLKVVLSDTCLSDIVWAVRGPDLIRGETLKDMYTWTIRVIACQEEEPAKAILSRITPDNLEMVLLELRDIEGNVSHYIYHIQFAFASLRELGLIPKDVYNYVLNTTGMIIDLRDTLSRGEEVTTESIMKRIQTVSKRYRKLYKKYIMKKRGGSIWVKIRR